jgi:hypothetical protein
MRELGIEMIPAYSPQARGRSERNFGTWQGRLPQELRLRGITTVEEANRFLREHYIAELNRKFSVPAAQPESAFVPVSGKDLDRIFSVQQERVVNQDNTVRIANRTLQIERTKWRGTLAKCHVLVCEHLDGTWSVFYGPHLIGRYAQDGSRYRSEESPRRAATVEANLMERGNPAPPAGFPLSTATAAEGSADTRTGQITC